MTLVPYYHKEYLPPQSLSSSHIMSPFPFNTTYYPQMWIVLRLREALLNLLKKFLLQRGTRGLLRLHDPCRRITNQIWFLFRRSESEKCRDYVTNALLFTACHLSTLKPLNKIMLSLSIYYECARKYVLVQSFTSHSKYSLNNDNRYCLYVELHVLFLIWCNPNWKT